MTIENKRNCFFDIIKCIAAFFVICIHYAPKTSILGTYFDSICRMAVPLFFMISGYYFDTMVLSNKTKRYIYRIIKLSFWASLFYFIVFAFKHYFVNDNFSEYLLRTFNQRNIINWLIFNSCPLAGHLWYLFALVYAVLFNVIVDRLNLNRFLPCIASVLLLLYCFFNVGYSGIYIRNWIFLGIPFFSIGRCLFKYTAKIQSMRRLIWPTIIILIMSFILLYFEMTILQYRDFYISLIPIIMIIAITAIKYPLFGNNTYMAYIGKVYSSNIYIYHIFIGTLLLLFINNCNVSIQRFLPIAIFIVTLLFSVLIRIFRMHLNIFKMKLERAIKC